MEYDDIRIPGPTNKTPRVPRELLTSTDLCNLADLVTQLDNSGGQITGSIQFKGHSIGLAYDSTNNRHYVGI